MTSFGHKEESAIRGKPKMGFVLDKVNSFLEQKFNSQEHPIHPRFPPDAAPNALIQTGMVLHSVGFTRTLAAKMIIVAVSTMGLPDDEFRQLIPVLKTCLYIKVVYSPAEGNQGQMEKSLMSKFAQAASTRPDAIQLLHCLSNRLLALGKAVKPRTVKEVITNFNKGAVKPSTVQDHNITNREIHALCFLAGQRPEYVTTLEQHWQNFKPEESGVTLGMFGLTAVPFMEPSMERDLRQLAL